MTYPPTYDFRALDPKRDRIITDSNTGAVLGIETDQGMQMLNGVSDYTSCMGSGLTSITTRNFVIPGLSQAVVFGGTAISGGSITCVNAGAFVELF